MIKINFLFFYLISLIVISFFCYNVIFPENLNSQYIYIYIIIIFLIILLFTLKKRYKLLSFIHPGTWFSLTWLVAIISYLLLDLWGYVPVKDSFLLSRLMLLIATTVLFFLIFAYIFPINSSIKSYKFNTQNLGSESLLIIFILISFIGAFVNWVGIGMPLLYNDSIRQQWLQEIPKITAVTWYPFHLIFPAAFFTGFRLPDYILFKLKDRNKYIISLILLFLSAFLWSFGTGGRQVTGFVFLYFFIGISFSVSLANDFFLKKKEFNFVKKKLYIFVILTTSLFILFSSITNSIRSFQQQSLSEKPFLGTPVLGSIGYFILYMGGTLMTHQAYGAPTRRNISETGPVSINGIFDWGVNKFNLMQLIGIRRVEALDTNPERAMAQHGQALAYGTRNIYYDLESDFGYRGTFLFVFIFVLLSQVIFNRLTTKKNLNNIINFVILIFIIMYWAYSQQLSLMMHGQLKWTVTSFLFWSISNSYRIFLIKKKSII